MSAVPAKAEFLSPLAAAGQFLAQKHAMGYRYREEGCALRQLDSFLTTRLSPEDPLITMVIVQDYVARRGTETESTRAHRLTLIREFCRFLQLEDARTGGAGSAHFADCASGVCRARSRQGRRGGSFCRRAPELAVGRTSPARGVSAGHGLAGSAISLDYGLVNCCG